jgi:DNA-binding SARP family transcriptional activator
MAQLRLLGGIDLSHADGTQARAVLSQPKRLALLLYLAVADSRGFHRRDTLLALFWPESPLDRARRALNAAVYYLRKSLGHDVILSRGDEDLAVNPERVWCDAAAFEHSLDAGSAEEGLDLYRGEFAPGLHLDGLREFDEWLEAQRGRLARRARNAALALADRDETGGEIAMAAQWAHRALTFAPRDELVIQRRITLLDQIGDRAGAVAAYDAFARRLREEIGVEPSPETQEVYAAVRARREPSPGTGAAQPLPVAAATPGSDTPDADGITLSPPAAHPVPPRKRRLWPVALAAAGVIIVTGIGGTWFARTDHPRTLIGEGAIERGGLVLLADFRNLTDDSTLADAVREGMRALLTDPRLVRLVSPTAVRAGLERMGHPANTLLNDTIARELAEREGAQAFVTGAVDRLGTGFQFTARVVGAVDGRELLVERVTADDETGVIDAVDRLGTLVRRGIGASIEGAATRPSLARVSTPSLSALRAYSAAWRADGGPQTIALAREAIAIDTAFAAAYVVLGAALASMARMEEARLAYDKAYELRDRLSEWERLMVESLYYARHLQLEGRERALVQVLALDPSHRGALVNLSDLRLTQRRFAEAESLAVSAIRLGYNRHIAYWNALEAQLAQGRDAAAESLLLQAPAELRQRLDRTVALAVRDWDAARAAIEVARDGHHLRVLQGLRGKLSLDERHLGTEFRWWPLQLLRYTGDTARAFRAVRTWRARVGWDTLPPAVRPYWILIPTLAEGGRVAEARRLLDEWRTLVPDDPRHRSDAYWSLGAIALAEGRLDSAAAAFLAWHDAPFAEDTHRYNRGLSEAGTALDRAGRPDTAIALYERALAIWTMDGVHYEATWYPLVLQRLAELHESLGNADRAIHYYGVFIDLWKDADPDLQPRVADASLALARLR